MKHDTNLYSRLPGVVTGLMVLALMVSACATLSTQNGSLDEKNVLIYTKNGDGYVHENIPYAIEAIEQLGEENGFSTVHSDDSSIFTDENLAEYDVIVFASTNNQTIDTDEQKEAFQRYIRAGGGFVAIHSASGSEREWPWFWNLLGGKFLRHPPQQDFQVHVINDDHPSTSFLPDVWQIVDDEPYYLHQLNPATDVLVAADLSTVEDNQSQEILDRGERPYPGDTFGNLFPLAWFHEFEGGRSWYTALGHRPGHYSDPEFLQHVLGGIQWAAGGD